MPNQKDHGFESKVLKINIGRTVHNNYKYCIKQLCRCINPKFFSINFIAIFTLLIIVATQFLISNYGVMTFLASIKVLTISKKTKMVVQIL